MLFTNLKWDGGVLVLGISNFLDLVENILEVLEDPTSVKNLLDMMKIKKTRATIEIEIGEGREFYPIKVDIM